MTIWSNTKYLNTAVNVPNDLKLDLEFRAVILLCDGTDLVIAGKVNEAISFYKESQEINPKLGISAYYWNLLAWYGCLNNCAEDILFACEKAFEVNSFDDHWSWLQETRGLARAMKGDLARAIEDFEAAINSGELKGEMLEKRQRWLEALKSGINPFTPEVLKALRASEGQHHKHSRNNASHIKD